MLELIDVTVQRGPAPIVSGLTVEITAGRPFWVIGPNGAGKSSLLRVMAGLDSPRSGSVRRTGPPDPRYLYFQSEMAIPAAATVGDWERLVTRLLVGRGGAGRTPLWPEVPARRRVGRLSTGERKRLLLDALFRRPGPLLLDEPFEHLSPDAKASLSRLIEERARAEVVVVATNQDTGRAETDGGLRLEGGVATYAGPGAGRVQG
jgi:ABC-type Mn2+/Zn2+ transport system ATPase subunit